MRMSVLLGINSGKVCSIVCQEHSQKMSVLFDVSSGKVCSIV